jgi:glycosyltransferase involved in cell wall biosynthesis
MIPKTTWLSRAASVHRVYRHLVETDMRPDIIHANVNNTADLAFMLGKIYHLPIVLTEHSSAYPRQLFSKTQALKARFFINQMQLIMPVSMDLSIYMRAYGIHGPFHVVSNTVDFNIFHPGRSKPSTIDGIKRILSVASLVKVKRIDLLLQAISLLKEKGRQFQLILAGDGPERGILMTMARKLNIYGVTTFLGMKNKQEIAELMRQADILILTSQWENQPVVILEALASGLPVLAPRVGGIPEILLPMCGRLVDPENVQSIFEQLEYLLDNLHNYRSDMIVEYARGKFSYAAVGQAYSQAYQKALENL